MGKNKFNAKTTYIGKEKFHSKKEALRWIQLQQWERDGKIKNLKRQVPYKLFAAKQGAVGGYVMEEQVAKYVCDFEYTKDGLTVVEDVKSPITAKEPIYRLKKKMMASNYGIEIQEV